MVLRNLLLNGKNLLSREQNNIFSAATALAIAFGISALLGILRDRILYARFYACCAGQLDAYNAAFRLPDLIFQLLVIGALSSAFIPIFTEKLADSEEKAFLVARTTGTLLLLLFLPAALLILVLAHPISSVITASFTPDQISLMANLTRIMIFAQFFFLISNLMTGVLQAKKRFLLPALSPIVYNLGIILGIHLGSWWGIYGPAFGVLIGAFLHFLIQLPLTIQLGLKFAPSFSFHLPEIKRIFKLMLPRTLSLGLEQIESTIILFFATAFSAGSLSLLYLGEHLSQLFSRLFGTTIGQAALPSLSSLAAAKKEEEFKTVLIESLLQAIYLTTLAAVMMLVLRIPIVRLAFGASEFPWEATLKTGKVIAFFTPAIIAQAGSQILTRGFYAVQDTRRPLLISIFTLFLTVVVCLLGINVLRLDILSLVIAISLSSLGRFIALMILLSSKISGFPWRAIGNFMAKVTVAAIASGVSFWVLMQFFDRYLVDTTRVIGLLTLTVVASSGGIGVYLGISFLFRLKQASVLTGLLKKLFNLHRLLITSRSQIEQTPELLETKN